MQSSCRSICVALVLAFAPAGATPGTGARAQGDEAFQRGGECKVVSIRAPGLKRGKKKGFSARDVIDLEFRARVRAARGSDHRLQLKLYAPQGHLYQVLTISFSLPAGQPGRGRLDGPQSVARTGVPAATAEARVVTRSSSRVAVLSKKLPVAGTLITNNSLYGRWRVVPFLDEAPGPCGPSRTFVINP
jgi:hypothetical protein